MGYILIFLTAISIFGVFAGSQEPVIAALEGTVLASWLHSLHIGNAIVFSLSVGVLVSIFFWLIVVYIPERKRRHILRNNLARYYQHFKEDTIQILLSASGVHDSKKAKDLCDYKMFKQFFSQNGNQRWYAALNGIQGNEGFLNDLLIEIELLVNEVAYILNNVNIDDEKVHSFFKRLSVNVYKLKNSSVYTADHVKYLGGFLWGILAHWSFIEGQREEDAIQIMIDKI